MQEDTQEEGTLEESVISARWSHCGWSLLQELLS